MISEFSLRCLVIFKNQVLVLKSQQKPRDDFLKLILDIFPSLYLSKWLNQLFQIL